MDINRVTALTIKYMRQEISSEEQAELNEWLDESPYNRERFEARIKEENLAAAVAILEEAENLKPEMHKQMIWQNGQKEKVRHFTRRGFAWLRAMAAAAIFIGLLAAGLVLWQDRRGSHALVRPGPDALIRSDLTAQDLPPGDNRATLTLDNGSVITLDSLKHGLITVQGGYRVIKGDEGKLAYQKIGASQSAGYNTVTTPRGGQYEVMLPDGTKVVLNAESSVSFPTSFNGPTREVTMTGEGFFEVAKDRTKPFRVSVAGATIVALGTEFNVMAYPDEKAIRTTLLEGRVKVTKGNYSTLLVPGQQAEVSGNIKVNLANVEEVTAWKNGLFEFKSADIQTVMRSLARWYNVKVRYEGEIPSVLSSGSISRNNTASVVLKVLQEGGFHFKIDGDTIIIKP